MIRTTLTALAVLAAAALVAGCSSADDKNEYVDTVNEIQNEALQAVNKSTASQSNSREAIVAQLEDAEKILASAVDDLEAVDVPEEAQEGHPKLVAGLDDMRKLFADTAKEVQQSSDTEAFTALTGLIGDAAEISADIDAAITQINNDLGAE